MLSLTPSSTRETAISELFRVALKVVREPKIRGTPTEIRRRLYQVTNALISPHKPEWFEEIHELMESLLEIIMEHIESLQHVRRFNQVVDMLALGRGEIPEHLTTWNAQWQTLVEKRILALQIEPSTQNEED